MKYFLTSAGLSSDISSEFLDLLSKSPSEASFCFISTASDLEEDKSYVEKDKKRFKELGFDFVEMDLKKEDENSLRQKLPKFDVIFVEGGYTYYLMKYIRESGFDKVIKKLEDKNIIYIGASAGSIAAGPDISIALWDPPYGEKDVVGIDNSKGMSLVNFVVFPHFEPEHTKIIQDRKDEITCPIIPLTDRQAILVDGKNIKFIGEGDFQTNFFNAIR